MRGASDTLHINGAMALATSGRLRQSGDMKETRSWSLFKREAPSRISTPIPEGASSVAGLPVLSRMDGIEPELAEFSEPTMFLGLDGRLIAANSEAHALGRRLGAPLDAPKAVDQFLAKTQLSNGGGSPPWIPAASQDAFEALVSAPEPWADEPVFELQSIPRHGPDGRPVGWVVRLLEITPLITALRGQRAAVSQRDTLLKLMSHDLRTPLAAILATLAHPDLGVVPDNLKQIIDSSARRALDMVDSNARLIRARSSAYAFIELDFYHVVEEVIDATWSASKEARVKLVLKPVDAEFPILADRGRLIEALTDLITELLEGSQAGDQLLFTFDASALRERPAVMLTIRCSDDSGPIRDRSEASRQPPEFPSMAATAIEDRRGLDFFNTVVARHSGSAICNSEPGVGRSVSISIPTVGAAEARA